MPQGEHRYRVASLVLAALLLGGCRASAVPEDPGGGTPAPARRPNVVLIVSDDQGWGDFGFMGHPEIRTPHLDRLAAEGALFRNGYVPSSLCRPSLATMITGLYPHQHRIVSNDPPPRVDRSRMLPFMREAVTLPRLLAPLGYRSLQTGKWWEGPYSNGGFTHGMTRNEVGGRHGDEGLKIGRETMQPIYDFIESGGDAPFFLWYAPMMPHTPHNPPERILRKYRAEGRDERLAKYWAMCEWFDETVGELLAFLDRKGLRDDTMVLFVTDNGWIQRTGSPSPGTFAFAPRSKRSPYDGGLRTPIIVHWPGITRAGRHDDLVSSIDLVPTILAAVGLRPLPAMQGENLLPVAAGSGTLGRTAVYGEVFAHDAVDLDRPEAGLQFRWIREGAWKLIVPREGMPELYRVADDPHEERNLAAERQEVAARLARRLDAWWKPR